MLLSHTRNHTGTLYHIIFLSLKEDNLLSKRKLKVSDTFLSDVNYTLKKLSLFNHISIADK